MIQEASTQPKPAARFWRKPSDVMQLARLGVSHPTRLSFLRVLLRRMRRERWSFSRPIFEFDARGVGRAVYTVQGPERSYSLVAFGHDLLDSERSDRVIATAWDATFCLFDGIPDEADLARLARNVPVQEAGRVSGKELTLSRANRSVRLFNHVVDALASGKQPDRDKLAETGYLMRTTAVYGSGKFGAASHASIAARPEVSAPFQAEMLTVWLIRTFTIDLVEHLARQKCGAEAVPLDPELRHALGVGNSTGLGMAPFLVRHPILLHNWIAAREEALARVRAQPSLSTETLTAFKEALSAAKSNAAVWRTQHDMQEQRLLDLREALQSIGSYVESAWGIDQSEPWNALWRWGERNLPLEGQEALLALMLEPHARLIDDLTDCLHADETCDFAVDGTTPVGEILERLKVSYAWALGKDYAKQDACARFWFISEDKLEPRLGERFEEPGGEQELPLDIARQANALFEALYQRPNSEPIAHLLLTDPEHRQMVRRVQITRSRPYAEIQANLIDADLMPIDMLRCKLAFFGASRFDPRSDRWVRISLFQGCPYPDTLYEQQ